MRNVYLVGDTTFDILFKGVNPVEANVGGSQLNTAVSLARLGLKPHFVSQVGNDRVGSMSLDFLQKNKVNTDFVNILPGNSKISLAFLDNDNNADYVFYKKAQSCSRNIPPIQKNDIILFGSSFSISEENRCFIIDMLEIAQDSGAIVIYDPNFRKAHAKKSNTVFKYVKENMSMSDIVKGSHEDFANIFNTSDAYKAKDQIDKINKSVLFYTQGANEILLYANEWRNKPVNKINIINTIGAGDNFSAGVIYGILKKKIIKDNLALQILENSDEIVEYAVEFSQHVCQRNKGYIDNEFTKKYIFS